MYHAEQPETPLAEPRPEFRMKHRMTALGRVWAPGIAVMLSGVYLLAQEAVAQFTSQVQLVEVYATVTDERGQPVTGLHQGDFEIHEDGTLQHVSVFVADEFPLTVVLGMDRSWSMAGNPLRLAKAASKAFLRALKPNDRSMILAISAEADIVAPLSTDRFSQIRAVEALDPWSTTALYDSIILALDHLEPESGRRALVIFSDGVDRYSKASAAQVSERARRSDALIYPIALGKTGPPFLAELATLSGGRSFLLRDPRQLEITLTAIARELRYQYLLGYAPSNPIRSGHRERRAIRVTLTNAKSGVRVRARDGYTTE